MAARIAPLRAPLKCLRKFHRTNFIHPTAEPACIYTLTGPHLFTWPCLYSRESHHANMTAPTCHSYINIKEHESKSPGCYFGTVNATMPARIDTLSTAHESPRKYDRTDCLLLNVTSARIAIQTSLHGFPSLCLYAHASFHAHVTVRAFFFLLFFPASPR